MIILLAYLAGCLAFLVPTARWMLRDLGEHPPEGADYAFAAAMGLCTCWFWPLYIPGWWVVQVLKTDERTK